MRGGSREGAGRPPGSLRPSGKKPRNFRLTDKEYELIKAYLKQIRSDKN